MKYIIYTIKRLCCYDNTVIGKFDLINYFICKLYFITTYQ